MNEEQIKKLEILTALLTTRVNSTLNDLMAQCLADVKATDPDLPFEEAASYVAGAVVATLLAQLRKGGCSEEARQTIVVTAVVLASRLQLPDLS